MPKPQLVRVRQNGDSGPVVVVSADYAQAAGLTVLSDTDHAEQPASPKTSARRRAAEPSHSGDVVASTPEEATE